MEQGETVSDFAPKKLARQLDFTAMCRASVNATLPDPPMHLQSQSQPPTQWQSQTPLQTKQQQQPQPQELQLRLYIQPQTVQSPPQPQLKPQSPPMPQIQTRPPPPPLPLQPQVAVVHRVPHPVQKLPLPTFQLSKQESPRSRPRAHVEAKDGTPKKQKQCNCKNSRCLKLYCECFASGIYCNGCNCINCHNNVDNEAARQEAVGATLERNPNAFRPKIASSPHRPQDARDDASDVQMVGKHNKGCHCKKSGCLKKYCECYQANILCSENCKCIDCKNFEESEERRALFHGDNNSMAYMQQAANAAISGAIGSSGYGAPLPSKKRRSEELLFGVAVQDQSIQKIVQHQQENLLRNPLSASSPLSAPVSHTAHTASLRSSKLTYRSPLADSLQPGNVKHLCSILVLVSSEAGRTLAAEKSSKVDRQTERGSIACGQAGEMSQKGNGVLNGATDNCTDENLADADRSGNSGIDGDDIQNGRPLSPGTRALMCDEEDAIFMAAGSPNVLADSSQNMTQKLANGPEFSEVHAEQERLVLTKFRDFLNQLITWGSIQETKCCPLTLPEDRSQHEYVGNGAVRSGARAGGEKEPYCNGIVKSSIQAAVEIGQTVSVASSALTTDLPSKHGLPVGTEDTNFESKGSNWRET